MAFRAPNNLHISHYRNSSFAAGYPGFSSGTGFFVRRGREVYFLTALHCLDLKDQGIPFQEMADHLTIPFYVTGATRTATDYVRFDLARKLAEDEDHSSLLDVVALRVKEEKKSHHQHLLSRAAKLPPTGDWLNRFSASDLGQEAVTDGAIQAVVMGYPNEGTVTSIDYDGALPDVLFQHVQFDAILRRSPLDNCFRLDQVSWPGALAGFSGSPVFIHFTNRHGKQAALAGMIIRGSNGICHFIEISILVEAVGGRRAQRVMT